MKYTLIELSPPIAGGGLAFLLLDKFCEYGTNRSIMAAPTAVFFALLLVVSVFWEFRKSAHKTSIDELLSLGIAGFLLVFGGSGIHGVLRQRASPGIVPDKIIQIRVLLTSDPMPISNGNWIAEGRLMETLSEDLIAGARGKTIIFGAAAAEALGAGVFTQMRGRLELGSAGDPAGEIAEPFVFFSKSFDVLGWRTRYHGFRHRLNSALIERLSESDPDTSSLTTALLLGRNTDPGSPVMRRFRNSGCIHLLALSGFHLGLIAIAIKFATKALIGFSASGILSALGAVVFLILVGPRPSLFRAVTMYLLWTLDSLRGYKLSLLSYLSAAFIIQTVIFPRSTATLSFQLSYLALCGLAIGGKAYTTLMSRYLPSKFSAAIGAGLGAQFFTLPTVLATFGVWRPIGILAAPLLTFLTAITMSLGSFRLVFANGSFPAVILDNILNHLVALISEISSPFAEVPAIALGTGPAWLFAVAGTIIPIILVWRINHGNSQATESRLPGLNPLPPRRTQTRASETLGSELPHQPWGQGETHLPPGDRSRAEGMGDRPRAWVHERDDS